MTSRALASFVLVAFLLTLAAMLYLCRGNVDVQLAAAMVVLAVLHTLQSALPSLLPAVLRAVVPQTDPQVPPGQSAPKA